MKREKGELQEKQMDLEMMLRSFLRLPMSDVLR
jgi:hypothetical protein